jgi:hypothetical protein
MEEAIDKIRAQTGENISLGRAEKIDGSGVKLRLYVHHDGKTGVLLVVEGDLADDTPPDLHARHRRRPPPRGRDPDDVPTRSSRRSGSSGSTRRSRAASRRRSPRRWSRAA